MTCRTALKPGDKRLLAKSPPSRRHGCAVPWRGNRGVHVTRISWGCSSYPLKEGTTRWMMRPPTMSLSLLGSG
jgi:hypothetical protein